MLKVQHLKTGYGKKLIIDDLSMHVNKGEIVAIIGHNGAGKSTLLKSIIGLLPAWSGDILFENQKLNPSASENVRKGISMIPQGSQVFDELTVEENLEIASFVLNDKKVINQRLKDVFATFPILKERKKQSAGKLSGGQQQILAFGMALIKRPKLLLMDEPSLGLAPGMVKESFSLIKQLNQKYGLSILIVEQKVREALKIAHRAYVLRLGKIALEGNAKEMLKSETYKKIFLS